MVRCIKKKVTDLLRALRTVPTAFWDKIRFLKKAIAVFHMIEQNIANVQIRNTTHNKKQVAFKLKGREKIFKSGLIVPVQTTQKTSET